MKIKKLDMRGISHLLVPLLVIVLVAIGGTYYLVASHADANQDTISLSPVSQSVAGGKTFDVSIVLKDYGQGVRNARAQLDYPTNLITVTSVRANAPWSPDTATWNETKDVKNLGHVYLNVHANDSNGAGITPTGTLNLATVTFKAVGAGTAAVTFNTNMQVWGTYYDANIPGDNGVHLNVPQIVNGSYTITSSAPAPTPTTLAPPTKLTAQPISESRIDLTWQRSAGASGYTVYNEGRLIGNTVKPSLSNTGLKAKTTYHYYVKAYTKVGNKVLYSDPSNSVSARTR